MQYSFYGGQQGKNFEIAKIFHNKVELMQDLMQRWHSSIGIGELVLISYGMPSDVVDQSYQNNRDIDKAVWGTTYNVTLWQKVYTEETSETRSEALLKALKAEYQSYWDEHQEWPQEYWDKYYAIGGLETQYIFNGLDKVEEDYKKALAAAGNDSAKKQEAKEQYYKDFKKVVQENGYVSEDFGLGYQLIASLIGSTPVLDIDFNWLDVNQEPEAKILFPDDSLEKPVLYFRSPLAQQLLPDHVSVEWVDADAIDKSSLLDTPEEEKAGVVFDVEGEYDNELDENGNKIKKINQPTLKIKIPKNQRIELADTTSLPVGSMPFVDFDDSGENVNAPKLTIRIPKSQKIKVKEMTAEEVLAPEEDPRVVINYSEQDTDKENPELVFSLPRAARFIYGEQLGHKRDETLTFVDLSEENAVEIRALMPGDYYINKTTGFIYLVTAADDVSRSFRYEACLAAPEPEVDSTPEMVPTFKSENGTWVLNDVGITKNWENTEDQTGLQLGFVFPRLPTLSAEVSSERKGPEEMAVITGKPSSEDTYTYTFKIPSGPIFYCGSEIDDRVVLDTNFVNPITEARPGDFYINTDATSDSGGHLYKLNASMKWEVQEGSIKGSTGAPLNIKLDCTINSDQVSNETDKIGKYILDNYLNKQYPKSNEIIAVTYHDVTDNSNFAYWYYYVNGAWGCVPLTGGVENFIQLTYREASDEKAYSVTYINNLLVALGAILTAEEKKHKTYSVEAIDEMVNWGSFKDL